MPIYEFTCKDCRENFEIITTSSSSGETVKCKKCGSLNVTKAMSAPSIRMSQGEQSIPSLSSGCSSKSGFS